MVIGWQLLLLVVLHPILLLQLLHWTSCACSSRAPSKPQLRHCPFTRAWLQIAVWCLGVHAHDLSQLRDLPFTCAPPRPAAQPSMCLCTTSASSAGSHLAVPSLWSVQTKSCISCVPVTVRGPWESQEMCPWVIQAHCTPVFNPTPMSEQRPYLVAAPCTYNTCVPCMLPTTWCAHKAWQGVRAPTQ